MQAYTKTNISQTATGCLSEHIHVLYSPKGALFISLNTPTLSIFFCFLASACLARVSQYASNPSVCELSVCWRYKILTVMKHEEAGLLRMTVKDSIPWQVSWHLFEDSSGKQTRKTKAPSLSEEVTLQLMLEGKYITERFSHCTDEFKTVIPPVGHVFKGHFHYQRPWEGMLWLVSQPGVRTLNLCPWSHRMT